MVSSVGLWALRLLYGLQPIFTCAIDFRGSVSMGHHRPLAGLNDPRERTNVARRLSDPNTTTGGVMECTHFIEAFAQIFSYAHTVIAWGHYVAATAGT